MHTAFWALFVYEKEQLYLMFSSPISCIYLSFVEPSSLFATGEHHTSTCSSAKISANRVATPRSTGEAECRLGSDISGHSPPKAACLQAQTGCMRGKAVATATALLPLRSS